MDADQLTPAATNPGPIAALEHRDGVTLLRRTLRALPKTLRTAVVIRAIQEMSYQEIASRLRLPEGTLKSRINRGRTELARQVLKISGSEYTAPGASDDGHARMGAYRYRQVNGAGEHPRLCFSTPCATRTASSRRT